MVFANGVLPVLDFFANWLFKWWDNGGWPPIHCSPELIPEPLQPWSS